jgi:hypothetical protein
LGQRLDVAIVGAGPYGLSVAAHLRGCDVRLFGPPMHTWLRHMPRGMHLKSDGFASNLYDPRSAWTLRAYCREQGLPYADTGEPVPLETFSSYGCWFASKPELDLDERSIAAVERTKGGFLVRTDDDAEFEAAKVVVAAGISHFARTPVEFAHLPTTLVSHSFAHHDLSAFAGRDVTVLGAGSSALDLAMLLGEAGAVTRVLARAPSCVFHRSDRIPRPLAARLRRPRSALGSGWSSLAYAEAPSLFRFLPARIRLRLVQRALGPAAPGRVRERLVAGEVPLLTGRRVIDASVIGHKLILRLAGGDEAESEIETDHLVAATGYRADVQRLPFLTGSLMTEIRTVAGSPVLNDRFESSVPGLHFVGLAAANTFGPVQRFAYGAKFAARRLAGLAG